MNSKGARGHKKFIPVWIKGTRCGAKIQRDLPAEIGISSGFFRPKTGDLQIKKKAFTEISRDFQAEIGITSVFSGRRLVTSKNKSKKKVFTEISRVFRPKSKFRLVFLILSPQKTLIWASICAPKPQTY